MCAEASRAWNCRCSLSPLQGRSQDLTQDLLDGSPLVSSHLSQGHVPPALWSFNKLVEVTEELWQLVSFISGSTLGEANVCLLAVKVLTNDGDVPLRILVRI